MTNKTLYFTFLASKAKNVRLPPKAEDNTVESETKPKETKSCGSPQYEIMKVCISWR